MVFSARKRTFSWCRHWNIEHSTAEIAVYYESIGFVLIYCWNFILVEEPNEKLGQCYIILTDNESEYILSRLFVIDFCIYLLHLVYPNVGRRYADKTTSVGGHVTRITNRHVKEVSTT